MARDFFTGPAVATFARFTNSACSAVIAALALLSSCLNRAPWQMVSRHRRPVAIAASIGLHVLFVLCLLPHSQSGFSAGGQGGAYQGEGEGLSLDLTAMALPDAQALEVREPEPETLTELADSETLDDLTSTETHALSEALADAPSLSQPEPEHTAATKSAQQSAARQGGEGQGGTSSGTFDDLWAAIAPCWRRIADMETLPVNLTVTFAGNGMLAKPPEIERAAEAASNPKALRSESLAITALAECGAYQMAAGRENVSIHFPTP
jgi:hypothetical protein